MLFRSEAEVEVRPQNPAPPELRAAPSPQRLEREKAHDECDKLQFEFVVHEEIDANAEKELTMQKHMYRAKLVRMEKSQASKRRGSPFGELERIYKAELELLKAKLTREIYSSDTYNAEANWLAQQCRLLRLQNANMSDLSQNHHFTS